MSRFIAIVVVTGCLLATGTLLLLAVAVEVGELTSVSAAVAALVLGCLAGLLTTFTGCTSLPSTEALVKAKERIETARDKLGRERLGIQLELNGIERLVELLEAEVGGRLGRWLADGDKVTAWVQAIEQHRARVEAEAQGQLQTFDMLIETAEGVIERAEAIRSQAQLQLEQSSFELPTGGEQSLYVLGWTRLVEQSTAALARARVRLELERLDRDELRLHTEGEGFGLVRLERLIRRVAQKPSRGRVATLAEQVRALIDRRAELLHVGRAADWDEVLAVIDVFTANGTPTLVVSPEAGADPTTIQISARLRIDESLVGPFTRGDVLVLSLPEGFTLSAPLQIEAAEGINLKICRNEAGSKAVALEIRGDWGPNPKWIDVAVDQALTIEGASALGWAGVWSLGRNTGTTVPVSVLQCG